MDFLETTKREVKSLLVVLELIFALFLLSNCSNGPSKSEIIDAIQKSPVPLIFIKDHKISEEHLQKLKNKTTLTKEEFQLRYPEMFGISGDLILYPESFGGSIQYETIKINKIGVKQYNGEYPVIANIEGVVEENDFQYLFSGIVEYAIKKDPKWGDWIVISVKKIK